MGILGCLGLRGIWVLRSGWFGEVEFFSFFLMVLDSGSFEVWGFWKDLDSGSLICSI